MTSLVHDRLDAFRTRVNREIDNGSDHFFCEARRCVALSSLAVDLTKPA